jgi:hypothetical protein
MILFTNSFVTPLVLVKLIGNKGYSMMTATPKLLAQRTDFKFKRSKLPVDYASLSTTPVIINNFRANKAKIFDIYSGVAGVYYWVNLDNATRNYIGSTVNIGSRMETYSDLMLGFKRPRTAAEKEFSNTSPSSWALIILDVCSPSEARVLEQLGLICWQPTMNKSHLVQTVPVPGLTSHTPGIKLATELASYYSNSSLLQDVFTKMAQSLINYDEAISYNQAEGVIEGSPVWVYDIRQPSSPVLVYGSTTRAKSQLRMRHSTLMNHIQNKILAVNNTLALSFTPLTPTQIMEFISVDLSKVRIATRSEVHIYNTKGEFITSFSSTTKAAPSLGVSRQLLNRHLTDKLDLQGRSFLYKGEKVYLRKVVHLRNP